MAAALLAAPAARAIPQAGSLISNRAEATYVPAGQALPETLYSNTVRVRVEAVESLALTADSSVSRPAGAPVALPHLLANTGNVASSYRFELHNDGGDDHDLVGLRLVRDLNGNGLFDAGEPALPSSGEPAGLALAPGETAALLVLGSVPATAGAAAPARALLRLLASTISATPASASVVDTVRSGRLAAVVLDKRADQAGDVVPGTIVRYQLVASNIGDRPAAPTAAVGAMAGASATPILIDGAAATVFLLRDPIPAGTVYVPGSLVSSLPGALRLYRLAGDAPFSYRSNGDDIAAVEVAVASRSFALAPNVTTDMGFAVRVLGDAAGATVVNVAQVLHHDGAVAVQGASNAVVLRVPQQRVGLAQRAAAPVYEHDPASGRLLGTARVRLAFVVENFGAEIAREVQLRDLLSGAQGFGRYTASSTPGPGEYTVIADSVRVASLKGAATLAFDPAYTGEQGQTAMLVAGSTLPPFGAAELSLDLRVHAGGRDGVILNTAQLSATLGQPAHTSLQDDSADGSVPDANGDGNPGNDASPTPIRLSLPSITAEKTAGAAKRLDGAARVYEVEYRITVTNTGKGTASHVQLDDNLDCTFRTDSNPSPVRSWTLASPPRAGRGLLAINPGYTGRGACKGRLLRTGDPYAASGNDPAVLLTDGTRHLDPGQTEVISYTVRFELDPLAQAGDRNFDNVVVASIRDRPEAASSITVVSALAAAEVVPLDPSGVVYNAVSRAPVPGATVTFLRTACPAGAAAPITEAELVPVQGLPYLINADGSVAQATDAQGRYAFVLRHPPVVDSCEYRITVAPPQGSGMGFPSSTLPPQEAVAPGGAVQVQPVPPTGEQPTTHYLRFRLGPGLPDVWNNHVPLDPPDRSIVLVAQKSGSRSALEIGQTVDYMVRVRNATTDPLWGLTLSDRLPPGFRYVPGSARLDGATIADPPLRAGAPIEFRWPALRLDAGKEAVLVYRALAGVGTVPGPAVNRAQAASGKVLSNEASHTVRVDGGVFSEEGFIVGKVYLGCTRDGVQGHEEIGIPGVRLLLEDGTGVVTDVEGKYSFYGLRAITHVLKVDTTTLPPGARLGLLDNRQAGRPDSRFVDLKKGDLHKADFAVENCDAPEVVDEVKRRRRSLAERPEGEGEAVSRTRLEVQPVLDPSLTEVRRRSAAGEIGPTGPKPAGGTGPAATPPPVFEPLRPGTGAGPPVVPSRPGEQGAPRAALPQVDLERLLAGAKAEAGFVDLKEGDTLPMAQTHVRVKGHLGATLRLSVNGRTETEQRVGKRVRDVERGLEAWEYIGVQLQPGPNRLQLDEIDGFGNVRATQAITLVAPGRAGRLEIDLPAAAVADAATLVRLRVRLTDDQGVPVTARTQLTLEIDRGRFESPDLNSAEQGTQVFIEGGSAEFLIVPPNEPRDATVRVSSGNLVQERRIAWLPELRPLVGAGIVEGVIDLRRNGPVVVGVNSHDAFEQTLRRLSSDDGRATGRVAFFFKGTVRGDVLLTAAYDSDKDTRERLFRDIQPDRYYPIYGDSAVRIFDAQSSERLFVRVDHQRSYLVYGDFTTDGDEGTGGDPRRLGLSNRAATGVKARHEGSNFRVEAFASHDSLTQQVVELPADGTSGPYRVPVPGAWRENSERVEILVRDRNQPGVVLRTIPMQRFTDYVIDPLGKRLLFAAPVASLDQDLNTRHIRVGIEVETGGEAFWMGGGHARVQVGEGVQLGASVVTERNPLAPSTVAGATAVVKPAVDPASTVIAEWARSDTVLHGVGDAGRIEWTRDADGLAVRAQATTTDRQFNNPASGFGPGRTEASATARAVLAPGRELFVEALASRDGASHAERAGATAMLSSRLGDALQAEVGMRVSTDTQPANGSAWAAGGSVVGSVVGSALPAPAPAAAAASGELVTNDLVTLRGRLGWRMPQWRQAQLYAEAEQDVRESAKRLLAIGGDLQLGEQTRMYGRYELISSLGSPYALNATQQNNVAVIGIDSAYLEGGRLFNEFRVRDAINGREAQIATGLRQSWQVSPGLRLVGGFERTAAFGGIAGNRSTALIGAAEYARDERLRLYGSLELREADAGDSRLNSLGVAYKIDRDWSLLGRSTVSVQDTPSDRSSTLLARQQLGLAWRQVDIDRWNALGRYEHYLKQIDGGLLAEREQAHIVSMHVNHQPMRGLVISGREALKFGRHSLLGISSDFWANLLQGRVSWDLNAQWDASVQAAAHWGQHGTLKHALGVESGVRLMDNLWVSAGYNLVGLRDELLAGGEVLDQGAYLRLRYKFDEGLFR